MPTTEGVVREPSAFSITFGCLPSIMATHELVVPRSMPMILLMGPVLTPLAGGFGGLGSSAAHSRPLFWTLFQFDAVDDPATERRVGVDMGNQGPAARA